MMWTKERIDIPCFSQDLAGQGASSMDSQSIISDLITRAKQDDKDALNELFKRYHKVLRLIVASQVDRKFRFRVSESDVVQDTLVKATRDFDGFKGISAGELMNWLKKILSRSLINMIRHDQAQIRDVRREINKSVDSTAIMISRMCDRQETSPVDAVIRDERLIQLAECLEKLPEDQQAAIRMYYLSQMSRAEVGKRLDRSADAVAGLLRRGLASLNYYMPDDSCLH